MTFSRVEKIGVLFTEIGEDCVELDDARDRLVFVDCLRKPIDFDRWESAKTDWENGNHNGDCVRFACSCMACHWADMLSNGDKIALILVREKKDYALAEWRTALYDLFMEENGMSEADTKLIEAKFRHELELIEDDAA